MSVPARRVLPIVLSLERAIEEGPPKVESFPPELKQQLISKSGKWVTYAYGGADELNAKKLQKERLVAESIHPDAAGIGNIVEKISSGDGLSLSLDGLKSKSSPPLSSDIDSIKNILWYVECGENEAPRMRLAFDPVKAIFFVSLAGNAADTENPILLILINKLQYSAPFHLIDDVKKAEFSLLLEQLKLGENRLQFILQNGPKDVMRNVSIVCDDGICTVRSGLLVKNLNSEELNVPNLQSHQML